MAETKPEIIRESIPLRDLDDIVDNGLRSLADHWKVLRRSDGRVPEWDSVFPLKEASVVTRSMLYEVNDGNIGIRIIGEQCREVIGLAKCKGGLYDLIPAVNADDIRNRIEASALYQEPNWCLKSMSWNDGRDHLRYEALFLPFTAKGVDACTRFYCPMAFYSAHAGDHLPD